MTVTDAQHVDQHACAQLMRDALERVIATQTANIARAADLVIEAIDDGRDHAGVRDGALALDRDGDRLPRRWPRAGQRELSIKDLVMYGDTAPAEILDPTIERDPELAARILALADTRPEDVFIIASNSGGNGSVVELARLARERGHRIVAVTSLAHPSASRRGIRPACACSRSPTS